MNKNSIFKIIFFLFLSAFSNYAFSQFDFSKTQKHQKRILRNQLPNQLSKNELIQRLSQDSLTPFGTKMKLLHQYKNNSPSQTCNTVIQNYQNSTTNSVSNFAVKRGGLLNFSAVEQHLSNSNIPPLTACEMVRLKIDGSFNELQIFNQNLDLMYPGSIINGNSVASGALSVYQLPNAVNRMPFSISAYLPDFSSNSNLYRSINSNFTSGHINNEIFDLMRSHQNAAIGSMAFEYWEVHSREEAIASLQIRNNAQIPPELTQSIIGIPIGADISNSQTASGGQATKKNYWIVKIVNSYFDVIADPDNQDPRNFFDRPNLIDCRAMYVNSVSYGRIAYIIIETEENSSDFNYALSHLSSVDFQGGNGSLQINARARQTINNSSNHFSGILIGVPGQINIGNADELVRFVTNIPKWGPNSPGTPIAYTLKFLNDGTPVRLQVLTENILTYCERIATRYRVEVTSISCTTQEDYTGNDRIYGKIQVRPSTNSNWNKLFSKSRANAISMDDESSIDIDGSREYVVPHSATSFSFRLRANLKERDSPDSDDILNGSKTVHLSNISGSKSINISSGSARYKVNFKIIPL